MRSKEDELLINAAGLGPSGAQVEEDNGDKNQNRNFEEGGGFREIHIAYPHDDYNSVSSSIQINRSIELSPIFDPISLFLYSFLS